MKKILLASMVGAVALLSGCEIVVEDPSCDIKMAGTRIMCVTSTSESYIHNSCKETNTILTSGVEGYGCAGGETLSCTAYDDDEGVYYTANFYYDVKGASCEQLLEGEDEYGFDEDDPYYMKAVKAAQKKLEAKK